MRNSDERTIRNTCPTLLDLIYWPKKKSQLKLILMQHLKFWTWIMIKRNSFFGRYDYREYAPYFMRTKMELRVDSEIIEHFRNYVFDEPIEKKLNKFSLQELKKRLMRYEKSSIAYGSFLRIVHDHFGYIDVGDRRWRRNMLATTLRCWWRVWPFSSQTSSPLSFVISVGDQHSKNVTNIETLSPTNPLVTNTNVAIFQQHIS